MLLEKMQTNQLAPFFHKALKIQLTHGLASQCYEKILHHFSIAFTDKVNSEQNVTTNQTKITKTMETIKTQPSTETLLQYKPTVNAAGEWVLSTFDVECLAIGAGVLGCGGGGSPYLGKLELLHCIDEGFQPKIVSPKRYGVVIAYRGKSKKGLKFLCLPESQSHHIAH